MKRIFAILFFIMLGTGWVFVLKAQANHVPELLPQQAESANSCEAIVNTVLSSLNVVCDKLGRNTACYVNRMVQAEFNAAKANEAFKFDAVGDKAPIRVIKTLHTLPMDVASGIWGVSLLKLQTNLPDTLPGQNVTFLVYGDTKVENADGQMRSFYFTSGLGNPACKETPTDAIIVKSPDHTQVTFKANGVDITIASTVVLRAQKNKQLDVYLMEGQAKVSTQAGSQELTPNQSVSVPLGGQTGLEAVGAPSQPQVITITDTNLEPLIQAAQKVSNSVVSIEGCITAVDNGTISVNGYLVKLDPATLAQFKVGDCLIIEGDIDAEGNVLPAKVNKTDIKPAKPTPNPAGMGMGKEPGMGMGTGMGMGEQSPPPQPDNKLPSGMGMGS